MNLMKLNELSYVLMNEEIGGEGEGAPTSGGSLLGSAGADDEAPAGDGDVPEGDGADGEDTAGGADDEAPVKDEEKGDGKEDDEEAKGAPEAYEEFTIPEGMQADEQAMAEFHEFARGLNLPQEQAQSLLEYHAKHVQQLFSEQVSEWEGIRKGWVDEVKKDPEIGGKAFDESMRHVAAAMKTFGSSELRQALDASGMGDNPELVRFFYRVGKLVSEPDFLNGTGGDAGERSAAKTLYPDMN